MNIYVRFLMNLLRESPGLTQADILVLIKRITTSPDVLKEYELQLKEMSHDEELRYIVHTLGYPVNMI